MTAVDYRGLSSLGLCLTPLCGPGCSGEHSSPPHGPSGAGKIPIRSSWQHGGYRAPQDLLAALQRLPPGVGTCNFGILTGYQPTAPLSVVVVDGDSPEALEWMRKSLPHTPWRVRTRNGEHWYYLATAEVGSRNLRHGRVGLPIDVKGNGGQVVAPGSTHATGHGYVSCGEPWTPETAALLPAFDPAWLPGKGDRGAVTEDPDYVHPVGAPLQQDGAQWPGERLFSKADLDEAAERVLSYAERLPPSVEKEDGSGTCFQAALKVLRGFPLASHERRSALGPDDRVPVLADDAVREAVRVLEHRWNPRCLGEGGVTPYPWCSSDLLHKVQGAARADRLHDGDGADYWLFDDPEMRRRFSLSATPVPADGVQAGAEVAATPPEQPSVPGRPFPKPRLGAEAWGTGAEGAGEVQIEVTHDTERMKSDAMRALGRIEGFYVKNDMLIDMVVPHERDRHDQRRRPFVRRTSKAHLTSVLNSGAYWYSNEWVGKGERREEVKSRQRADLQTVSAVLAAGVWPTIRHLEGVVYAPVVRPSGTILQEHGYDPETKLYYHKELDHGFIPSAGEERGFAPEAMGKAMERLMYVVKDFPFESPAARSVWLAAVLTRFARFTYAGSAPLFAVSACEIGSGKSLLAECAAIISEGRPVDVMAFSKDPEESQRALLTLLGQDETHTVCFDNMKEVLSGSAYEAMLTARMYVGRTIGTSNVKRIVMGDVTWWATGNNLEVGHDMSRRVLLMKIFDRSGSPTKRRVTEKDLKGYCYEHRAELVRACLFVLSGFICAGAPQVAVDCDGVALEEPLASFEGWDSIVRRAVVWAGLPDPCRALASADPSVATERSEAETLVYLWRECFGVGKVQVSEAYKALTARGSKHQTLTDHLTECSGGSVLKSASALTRYIKRNAGGVYADKDTGKKYRLVHGKVRGDVVQSYTLTESQ